MLLSTRIALILVRHTVRRLQRSLPQIRLQYAVHHCGPHGACSDCGKRIDIRLLDQAEDDMLVTQMLHAREDRLHFAGTAYEADTRPTLYLADPAVHDQLYEHLVRRFREKLDERGLQLHEAIMQKLADRPEPSGFISNDRTGLDYFMQRRDSCRQLSEALHAL